MEVLRAAGFAAALVLLGLPGALAHGPVSAFEPTSLAAPGALFSVEAAVHARAPGPGAAGTAMFRAGDYDVQFMCPTVARNQADAPVCPSYLVDAEDVLGQPVLVVDPHHPGFMAFNALHGGPGPDVPGSSAPPSSTARDNAIHQPHTTFQSRDAGGRWDDNRYYARLDDADRIWGVDNAMGADEEGDLTIVSVYAVENGDERSYKATLHTAGRAAKPVDYDRDYVVRGTLVPGASMHDAHVVSFGATQSIVAMWLEGEGQATQLRFMARAQGSPWSEPTEAIDFCDAISNPISQANRLMLLCRISPGADVAGVADGSIQLVAIDDEWQVSILSEAPLRGTNNLRLADASATVAGGVVAAGGSLDSGKARVQVAFGVVGGKWAPVRDYRDSFSDPDETRALVAARVNALAYLATSGTVHMILAEEYDGLQDPDGSPFRKVYGVVHGGGRLLGTWSLGYGDPASRVLFPAHVAGLDAGVYDDPKDSIVIHETASGDQRAFIAYGDHGVVRYAELLEIQPTPPAFPPITPASPIPAPLAGVNPAVVAAVAGVLSTAAVARMAAAKKKKTAEAPSL